MTELDIDRVVAAAEAVVEAERGDGPRITAQTASDITPTPPEWLWRGWLLKRALNLLVARQGTGKTTFAAHVTAALTRGFPLPGDEAHDPIRVGFLSLEEPADRVVARLHAANADLVRVIVLGDVDDVDDEGRRFRRRWRLPGDVGILGQAIEEHGLGLVIVDGLGYSISGTSHNYSVVGTALSALAGEAERTLCAVLGLVHPPKGSSDPVTAAIGSTAWTAIPRVSIVMGLDPNDATKETRVVSVGKSNYKLPEHSLAFTIAQDPTFECGAVVGLNDSAVTAEEVMAAPPTSDERTERALARDFIFEALADGPVGAEELNRLAESAGISARTIKRARGDVGVVSRPKRDPNTGRTIGWTLDLPSESRGPTRGPAFKTGSSGHSGLDQEKDGISLPEDPQTETGPLDLLGGVG